MKLFIATLLVNAIVNHGFIRRIRRARRKETVADRTEEYVEAGIVTSFLLPFFSFPISAFLPVISTARDKSP